MGSRIVSLAVLTSVFYIPVASAVCLDPVGDIDSSGASDVVDVQCMLLTSLAVLTDIEDLRHKVSVERAIRSVGAAMNIRGAQDFAEAVVRIRREEGLYSLRPSTVTVDQQTLFRTAIDMPANLTEGAYTTRVLLTRGGEVVSSYETAIDVRKVGLERFLYALSRERPFIYGIMSLVIAVLAGWGASAAFQLLRDR